MTDVTATCTFKLLSCREGKMYSVALPTTTVGGDTFTVDNTLNGLRLGTVQGCLLQRSNSATASATYSTTTITVAAAAGTAVLTAQTCLVWGY